MAWAGAIADRHDKPRLLQITSIGGALIALTTAVLVTAGHRSPQVLGIMALLAGVAAAFETPTRQSLAAELVPPADLPSAVGLNGAIMTSSRLVGTAVAGLLIAGVGPEACLYLNAVSFLAVVVAMTRMRRQDFNPVVRAPGGKGQIPSLRWRSRRPPGSSAADYGVRSGLARADGNITAGSAAAIRLAGSRIWGRQRSTRLSSSVIC